MRRDIEIADQDMAVVAARMQRFAGFHLVEELQLVREFRIERGIGNITARRDIKIMQHKRRGRNPPEPPNVTVTWRKSILSQNVRMLLASNGSFETTATP